MKSFSRIYEELKAERRKQLNRKSRLSFKQFIADQNDEPTHGSSRNLTTEEIRSALNTVLAKRLRSSNGR